MLGAPFLAALQVLIYTGAIVVLFLFVIMLLNVQREGAVPGAGRAPAAGRGAGRRGVRRLLLLSALARLAVARSWRR